MGRSVRWYACKLAVFLIPCELGFGWRDCFLVYKVWLLGCFSFLWSLLQRFSVLRACFLFSTLSFIKHLKKKKKHKKWKTWKRPKIFLERLSYEWNNCISKLSRMLLGYALFAFFFGEWFHWVLKPLAPSLKVEFIELKNASLIFTLKESFIKSLKHHLSPFHFLDLMNSHKMKRLI